VFRFLIRFLDDDVDLDEHEDSRVRDVGCVSRGCSKDAGSVRTPTGCRREDPASATAASLAASATVASASAAASLPPPYHRRLSTADSGTQLRAQEPDTKMKPR
jgi:hypothetical protein